jgi:hypothetical protein
MQRHVSDGCDYNDREKACENGADASKSSALTLRFDHFAHLFHPRA